MQHTTEELIACIKREIVMRQKVYPGRIAAGRMTVEEMTHEIACMYDVLEIVKKSKDRSVPMLFDSAS